MYHRNQTLFIESLADFIEVSKEVSALLQQEVKKLDEHHENCNKAKTIGTTASVIGAGVTIAALVAAPITGGASISLLTGYGIATAFGGTAVNIGTDLTEYYISKSFEEEFKKCVEKRNKCGLVLEAELKKIRDECSRYEILGLNEEEALVMTLKAFLLGRNITHASLLTTAFVRTGGNLWKSLRLVSNQIQSVASKFGIQIGKRAVLRFVRRGVVFLNVFSIIWDVNSLISDWKTKNPTSEMITDFIQEISSQITELEELQSSIYSSLEYNQNEVIVLD